MGTQIKKRIDWLDIAKGIAIICTIIGHSFGKNRIGVFIFSFHMPIFFILSGYTLKKIQFSEFTKATFYLRENIEIEILEVYPGTKFNDTCISDVYLIKAALPIL